MTNRHSPLGYHEQFGLLSALSEEQRRLFVSEARILEAKRGTRVYLPGERGEHIYLIKSGIIRIARRTRADRDVVLAFLHSGELFGELAMIEDTARDHVAEAVEDAVIWEIPRNVLIRLMEDAPRFGVQITKLIGLRLRRLESRIEELLGATAQARLAQTLLQLANEHGVADRDGVLIPLRLNQTELGRLVGLRRETVNAILQEWRARGLVEADRRSIRLRDARELRRLQG